VLTAVELYDQLRFRTAEIYDEGADGMLAAEPCANEPAITEVEPYRPLGICLIAPESPRVTLQILLNLPPHPALSPDGGEGIDRNPLPSGERAG